MSNNLVSERVRAGMTRAQLAHKLNRSEDVVGKWERGETSPRLIPDAVSMAGIFGCSVDYLAGISSERGAKKQGTVND